MTNSKVNVHFQWAGSNQQHSSENARLVCLQATPKVEPHSPRRGWGQCYVCGCAGFVQSYGSNICGRCGHSYTEHW
jgi:uncharacterized membrane protein